MADDPLLPYTGDPATEAGGLTERELAILLMYPADPEGLADLQGLYEEARVRVQGILDAAVATRAGKACDHEDCPTPAAFKITPAEGDALQSCETHLGQLMGTVAAPSEVTPIT